MEKTVAKFLIEDMKPTRDKAQYGNQKGLSVQHYLIRMLDSILSATDRNSQNEKFAVVLSLIDWSQAFDRMSHQLGIKAFIDNGVRPSLIPYLMSYFQDRKMVVKWNGPTFGLLEYLANQTTTQIFLVHWKNLNSLMTCQFWRLSIC